MSSEISTPSLQTKDNARVEKRRKAVQLVLSSPVYGEFSESVRKIRNSLMIVSVVAIFSIVMGVEVSSASSVGGIQFTGLTSWKISIGLFCVTLYMLGHFLWSGWDSYLEWRMRCSGTSLGMDRDPTGLTRDPRQMSLMLWWANQVEWVVKDLEALRESQARVEAALSAYTPERASSQEQPLHQRRHELIDAFNVYADQMQRAYSRGVNPSTENSIKEQLFKFEVVFRRFLNSQNSRWLGIELLLPVILGVVALLLLLTDLNWNPFYSLSVI